MAALTSAARSEIVEEATGQKYDECGWHSSNELVLE